MLPIGLVMPAMKLFDADVDPFTRYLYFALFVAVIITACWWLLALPFRWLSEADHQKVNDEWAQAMTGDACKWAVAAFMTSAVGLMAFDIWRPLNTGEVIYGLVSAALLTGVTRMSWLSRREPLDDD
jgi:hypothetical protein